MKALLLLYYFPPSGGPGVQRGVKLCRYLPAHGVTPSVVTVAAETYRGRDEYALDPALAADVDPALRVVRTPSGDRPALKRLLQRTRLFRLAARVFPRAFYERQAGWYSNAVAACLREIEETQPEVLLTSSQPFVVHLAAQEVRRRTGIPWVADFRDPWTQNWGRVWPDRAAFDFEDRLEAEVLTDADMIVWNTPGARRQLLERRPWLDPAKVVVIPNGYDPEDFRVEPAARPVGSDELRIVHSGSFRGRPPGQAVRTRLRGWIDRRQYTPVPYDVSTHSPEALFQALAQGGPEVGGRRVRVRLVGELDAAWRGRAEALGVADRLDLVGYRPHPEAIAELLAADLLYLPTITRRDGGPVGNVPAKTYEYLGSGRPLVALAGPGDVRDLVAGRERVTLLAPRDSEGLSTLIERAAAEPGAGSVPPDPADARSWRRQEIAARMADVLRRCCSSVMQAADKTSVERASLS